MAKPNDKQREGLTESQFAFEKQRKEPLETRPKSGMRWARFNQWMASLTRNRDAACKRIQTAAKKFGLDLHETIWREIDCLSVRHRTSRKR